MRERDTIIDLIRAIGVLWIVGFYHLSDYTVLTLQAPVYGFITRGVLTSFTFVSGILLGRKSYSTKEEIVRFARKRILHLYFPFMIACLVAVAEHFLIGTYLFRSTSNAILTVLGLSSIILPATPTLWFVCMMFVLYCFTPFILHENNMRCTIARCVGLYVVLWGIHLLTGLFDERVLLYYPSYIAGFLMKYVPDKHKKQFPISFMSLIGWIVLCSIGWTSPDLFVVQLLVSLLGIPVVYTLAMILNKSKPISQFLGIIGQSSMCIYLFHRQVYSFLCYIIGGQFSNVFAVCVAVPFCIVCGYLINASMRVMINRLERGA